METIDIYKELFGEEYYDTDIGPSYDLDLIKDIMIGFSENELEDTGIDFDAFKWTPSELFGIILGMLNKYDAIKNEASLINILKFIAEIRSTYNDVPYHTFQHATDVCFVTYYMFTELRSNNYLKYSRLEVIAMLIAALGHDMHHPGYNNLFQINTKSELAIRYDGKSVLEQYSADCLIEMIENTKILDYLNIYPDFNNENNNNSDHSSSVVIPNSSNEENSNENEKSIETNNKNIEKKITSPLLSNEGYDNISHRFDNISKDPIIPKVLDTEFKLLDKEVKEGLHTAEEVYDLKREKIKKFFCDLIVEVILSTDMSTHFQLQDDLANICKTLNPSSDCLFTMENDLDNNESYANSVYEEEEFIHMEEPYVDKNQAIINSTEFKDNSNFNSDYIPVGEGNKEEVFDYCQESLSGYSNFENYTILNQNQHINNDIIYEEMSDSKRKSDLEVYQLGLSVRLLERKQYQLLSESQRRTILNGLLHAADISNAARPWYICEAWSNRVVEEFWRQGDEEKRLNLTVSPNMDRDRFERNGISIAFNDFITTPFYEVIYELIPTFELFVKLLHINRQKWNDLVALSNSETSIIALDTKNSSLKDLSQSIGSLEDFRTSIPEPNNGRRLSIAAGTLIIPDNFLNKISIKNDYQRSLSVQSDHYPKCNPLLNMSRVSSSYIALNDSNPHINEFGRSRARENHDVTDKYILSQSTHMKKIGSMNNTSDSMEKLGSAYRNRRCQSVDTTYTRNT